MTTPEATHAAALGHIEKALEVEDYVPEYERAWLWNEATDDTLAGWGYHIGQMLARLPRDRQTEDMQESIEAMLDDLRAARDLLRPALEGAREVLQQHRPVRNEHEAVVCHMDRGYIWRECPDAARALALADLAASHGEGSAG